MSKNKEKEQQEKLTKEYSKLLKEKTELENDRNKALEKEKGGKKFIGWGSKHYSEELEKNEKKIKKIESSNPEIAKKFKQKTEQKEQEKQQKEQKLQEKKQQQELIKQKKEQQKAIEKHVDLLNEKTDLQLKYNKELDKEKTGERSPLWDSKHYAEKLEENKKKIENVEKSRPEIAKQFEENTQKQKQEVEQKLRQQSELSRRKEQEKDLKKEEKYNNLELVELRKEKRSLDNKMHKLLVESEEIKSKINKLEKSTSPDQQKLEKLGKELQENSLARDKIFKPHSEINGRIEDRLNLVNEKISSTSTPEKERKTFEKELASYKEAIEKSQKTYEKHRDELFNAVKSVAKDEKTIDEVLGAFVEDKKGKLVSKGLKLVGHQAGVGLDILTSIPFLKKEAQKFANVINGVAPLDPNNPPFFLKMMQDPEGQKFFKENGQVIDKLVSTAAPKITEIVLKQLSDLKAIDKKIEEQQKKLPKGLAYYEKKLEQLKDNSKADPEKIKKLEQKIQPLYDLQNQKQIAQTIKLLKAGGIDNEYIEEKILPIIQNVTKELLVENPAKFAQVVKLASNMMTETDPIKKNEILTDIIKQVDITKLVTDDSIKNFISPENSKDLVKIANVVIDNNPGIKKVTDNLGVTPKLINDIVPFAVKIGQEVLKNPSLGDTVEAIKGIITNDAPSKLPNAKTLEEVKELDDKTVGMGLKVASTLPNLLMNKEVIGIIKSDLPKVLDNNKEAIGKVVSNLMPGLVEGMKTKDKDVIQKISEENGLDPKAVESIVFGAPAKFLGDVKPEFYSSAVNAVLPLVSNIIKAVDENKVQELYRHVQILTKVPDEKMSGEEVDQLKELQSKAMGAIVQEGIKLVSNDKVSESIKSDLSKLFLDQNVQKGLGQIISNAEEYVPALKQLGIDKELMKNLIPFASNTAGSLLQSTPSVIGLYNAVSGGVLGEDEDKVRKNGYEVSRHIQDLLNPAVSKFGAALQYGLSDFLRKNQEGIKNSVGNYYDNNPEFAKNATKLGFDKQFAQDLTDAGTSILIDTSGPLVSVIQGMTKDGKNMADIFEQVNKLAMAEGTLSKISGAAALGGLLYNTISSNKDLKAIFTSKLPEILDKNNEKFGAVLDNLMSKTAFGRNMTVKGADILRVLQNKTPEVMELLDKIDKGNKLGVAISLAKIIIDPKMLSVAATLIGDAARYNYQKNIITNATRQKEVGAEMSGMLADSIKNMPIPKKGEPLTDLGSILEKQVNLEQKNSLQYSLKNHDFRGLQMHQNPLKLENFKINDFKFTDTQFKEKVSFEGSQITDVSFKNTKFEKGASFEGATIDAKSLETLLPAIRKHNGQHPENKITLDGVKITGDISKLSLRDISLKGADLTEAQTVSKKLFGGENKTDVYHADLTDAKFAEKQKFKNKAHADISNQQDDKSFKKYEDKVLTSLATQVKKNLGKDHKDNLSLEELKKNLHQNLEGQNLRSAVESIEKNVKVLAKNIVGEHKKSGTNRPLSLEQISKKVASHVVQNNGGDKKGVVSSNKLEEKKQREK